MCHVVMLQALSIYRHLCIQFMTVPFLDIFSHLKVASRETGRLLCLHILYSYQLGGKGGGELSDRLDSLARIPERWP